MALPRLYTRAWTWTSVAQSQADAEIEWMCISIADYNIVNIYIIQAPTLAYVTTVPTNVPLLQFKRWRHIDWGYNTASSNGESLADWAANNHLALLFTRRNQTVSIPGAGEQGQTLTWLSRVSTQTALYQTDVCLKFPRSQHRPSLIMAPKLVAPIPSAPVKRWNFKKADWNQCCLLTSLQPNYHQLTPPR